MTVEGDLPELKWTSSVKTVLPEDVDYLWPRFCAVVFVVMDKALQKRGLVYSTRRGERSFMATFGVEDDEVDDAKNRSEELVKSALGSVGVRWSEVICIKISPNEELMQEIDQIRVYGNFGQEAKILPLVRPEKD